MLYFNDKRFAQSIYILPVVNIIINFWLNIHNTLFRMSDDFILENTCPMTVRCFYWFYYNEIGRTVCLLFKAPDN